MNPAIASALNTRFVQVALPILIGFITIGWWQNKRLDEISKRIDDLANRVDSRLAAIDHRLERIEVKLDNHAERIARLEERTTLVRG